MKKENNQKSWSTEGRCSKLHTKSWWSIWQYTKLQRPFLKHKDDYGKVRKNLLIGLKFFLPSYNLQFHCHRISHELAIFPHKVLLQVVISLSQSSHATFNFIPAKLSYKLKYPCRKVLFRFYTIWKINSTFLLRSVLGCWEFVQV